MKFNFDSVLGDSNIKLNNLKLDLNKLDRSLAVHSGNVTGFKAIVDKFQIALFGYSKKDSQTINDTFNAIDKGIEDQINIYEKNKDAFKSAAKIDKNVARFIKLAENKDLLNQASLNIKEGTASKQDYSVMSDAFNASSRIADTNIGLEYKKSDYIQQLSSMIKQTSDNEEKEELANTLVDFLASNKVITETRTEILKNLIKENDIDNKFINQIEGIYQKQAKSSKDIVKASSIDQLRESGFKTPSTMLGGMGIGSKSGVNIADTFGGMGGLMKFVSPMLPVLGAAMAAPSVLPAASKKAESTMGDIGETLMLLGLILPVVVDAVYKKFFGGGRGEQVGGVKNIFSGNIKEGTRQIVHGGADAIPDWVKDKTLLGHAIKLIGVATETKEQRQARLQKSNEGSNITYKDKLLTDKENIQKSRTPIINNVQSGGSGGGSVSSSSSPKAVGPRDKSHDGVVDAIKQK